MQRKSSSSAGVKLFKLDYSRVIGMLKKYAEECINKKGAELVILIGSLARGDYTAFSDADIVIVVPKSDKRPVDRIKDFIDPYLPIDIEPRVYTEEELKRMAAKGAKIVREILKHGILLAGSQSLLNKLIRSATLSGH